METSDNTMTLVVEYCDNGFTVEDMDSLEKFVIEESKKDGNHNKLKQHLGDILYKELDGYYKECILKVGLKITFIDPDKNEDLPII